MTLFTDMPPHSRVWIYQSSREFTSQEVSSIKSKAETFVAQWTSHDQLMKASIEMFHTLFVVICVDEKTAPASGCGIDKSMRFIQELEKEFGVSLTDRMNVVYRSSEKGELQVCRLDELKNKRVTSVFNNLVTTKGELEKNWEVPVEMSWHKQFIT